MNKLIFNIVAKTLLFIGRKTGRTYNEINIIAYYFIIPFTWLILLDIIFEFHYLKYSFVIFCFGFFIGCNNFRTFSDWLFQKSVKFLMYFNKVGSNYIISSVLICVLIPIIIYTILFILILK